MACVAPSRYAICAYFFSLQICDATKFKGSSNVAVPTDHGQCSFEHRPDTLLGVLTHTMDVDCWRSMALINDPMQAAGGRSIPTLNSGFSFDSYAPQDGYNTSVVSMHDGSILTAMRNILQEHYPNKLDVQVPHKIPHSARIFSNGYDGYVYI